eukprot:TRINITY_DN15880_c0_g1_i1.p1 TRINITY_DN15880_c0_g1~~TRINITY_DN15880_c0_g1_i1.p1  ORF type:complete len:258 (-),score=21.01 TRINITY_DN15880_c0_g1_i1:519-1292(-)
MAFNMIGEAMLEPGDHIYSWRTAYTYAHHGIYAGEDRVIHFTRSMEQELGTGTSMDRILSSSSSSGTGINGFPCLECGTSSESSGVLESCLKCFLAGGRLHRYKYGVSMITFLAQVRGGTCSMAVESSTEEVLHRARYLHGYGFGPYNVVGNNCEDFALYCKTGVLVVDDRRLGRSGQCAAFFGAPLSGMLASPLYLAWANPAAVAVLAGGLYSLNRYAHDIGVRHDVLEVSVEDLVLNLQSGATDPHQPFVLALCA